MSIFEVDLRPTNDFHMFFSLTLGVDGNVIKIQYHKNVEFLC